MNVELVLNAKCLIGEGPCWDEPTKTIYFVDLLGNRIYSFDGKIEHHVSFDQNLGAAVVREKGGLAAAMQHGYYFVDFPGGGLEKIADPEAEYPDHRFNDGKCDAKGRFWAGTMSKNLDTGYGEAIPDCGLYCLDTDGKAEQKLSDVIQGNGLGWTKDSKKMYFIDSQTYTVQEFDFDLEKGSISNGRIAVEVPKEMGLPDGMTVDDDGMLWIALWGGGCVSRWNPKTGELLCKIEVPAKNVTACTFGGPDMNELYITTAKMDTDEEQYPHAGGLFKIKLDITGTPSYRYQG
ncbi:SMP-30/gluconolactonase/LRE family protein [Faecalicatena orotica]|uniref:Sugar lactone lactonase YvrE n=1 Tax=Faecalicatena orotica TaxID=1544 RepID=A0A2Y9C620_9FIRM|nr:SMP-30/gluconolactonase/LRE family protein [Faecalicatena orotica]PWJ23793.1 sugar lactone lactonase YvrE [Faecalicatena orotica]SSA57352.1 Sugar lactone lactonase YvrE [Faecalicatena orotica]